MKKLERIFLYTVLAILVFYVFLVDGNVEGQVAIQEEILARRIAIVNDAGQEVVLFFVDEDDNGLLVIYNKDSTPFVTMGADVDGGLIAVNNKDDTSTAFMGANVDGGVIGIYNKDSTPIVFMGAEVDGGVIGIYNKDSTPIVFMGAEVDGGLISVCNKSGEVIGTLP